MGGFDARELHFLRQGKKWCQVHEWGDHSTDECPLWDIPQAPDRPDH